MSGFVLITRHPSDCAELQRLLDPCGLKLRPYPVLRLSTVTNDQAWERLVRRMDELADSAWIVIASPRASDRFAEACRSHEIQVLLDRPVAVVGPASAAAARAAGLNVALVGGGTGTDLGRELGDHLERPTPVIFACGRDHRRELPQELNRAGHEVIEVVVYRMDPTPSRELPPLGPSLEAVVLTSPRAAELYLAGVGGLPLPCEHWAFGPTTAAAASTLGIDCRVPPEPTIQSLAEELCKS